MKFYQQRFLGKEQGIFPSPNKLYILLTAVIRPWAGKALTNEKAVVKREGWVGWETEIERGELDHFITFTLIQACLQLPLILHPSESFSLTWNSPLRLLSWQSIVFRLHPCLPPSLGLVPDPLPASRHTSVSQLGLPLPRTPHHRLGASTTQTYLLTVGEAGSLRSQWHQNWFLLRPLSL